MAHRQSEQARESKTGCDRPPDRPLMFVPPGGAWRIGRGAWKAQSENLGAFEPMVAALAHDVNNVLTIIEGYGDVLLGLDGLPGEGRRSAQEIKRAAERAFLLTRQLLSLGQMESPQPRAVHLGELVAGLVPLMSRMLGEDIELTTVVGEAIPPVSADPVQVERTFMLLAAGVRNAMPQGGRLGIEIQRVADPGAAAAVRVIVRDAGCGLDGAARARLFEPFLSFMGMGQGTGMGWVTARGTLNQCGGAIRVSTADGPGAIVTIDVPAAEEEMEESERPDDPLIIARGGETVLVVEDEEGVRTVVRAILTQQGYRVLEARNAFEAIRASRRFAGRIHAAVVDIVLPGVDGRTLGAALKFMRPDSALLYMSGNPAALLAQRSVPSGAVVLLRKPFTPAGLSQALRTVLAKAAEQELQKAAAQTVMAAGHPERNAV